MHMHTYTLPPPHTHTRTHTHRTTEPQQPSSLGISNLSANAPSAKQTTPPIEEHNKFGNTKRVGNCNESSFSYTDSPKENTIDQIDITTHETMVTYTKGATGTDLPQADYLLEPSAPYQPSSFVDEMPKLNTVVRSREKWAEEDNQSESSHSSVDDVDDRHPLLN